MVQGVSTKTNTKEKSAPETSIRDHASLECAGKAKRRRRFGFSVIWAESNDDPKRCRAALATALQIIGPASANPTAAGNSPLSGRIKTASPPSKPATIHHLTALRKVFFLSSSVSSVVDDRKASVTATNSAVSKKFVSTSVRIVA